MLNTITAFFQQHEEILIAIGSAIVILAVFWLAGVILTKWALPAVEKRLVSDKHRFFSILICGFKKPLSVLFKVLGLFCALLAFSGWMGEAGFGGSVGHFFAALPPILYKCLRIAFILALTWGLVSSSGITSLLLRNARNKLDLQVSKSVTRFLAAVFNVVVIAISAVVLISELGYNINGLITGLGLGGLTVALAAKDSAANFFGGLVLIIEKPFEIGDWITTDEVEGTVEDINLRSTKVRTAPGSLTIVPNAKLSDSAITNWSGVMEKRRANFTLSILYETPRDKILAFTDEVRSMLKSGEDIVGDSVIVEFTEFAPSSLDIQVIFYTSLPGYGDHLRIRQRVNLTIMELAEKHGIAFAYPTNTVHISNQHGEAPHSATPNSR